MPARLGAVLCLVLCAAGCATTGPSDVVRDPDSAILRAKQICKWEKPLGPAERWRVNFRGGKWHVWSTEDYGNAEEPRVGYQGDGLFYADVWINPRDGSSGGCGIVID